MKFEVRRGYGSRKNRVHIFDRRHGYFICSGYIKDKIIYTSITIKSSAVIVRKFDGRKKNANSRDIQKMSENFDFKAT